ncbi:bud emergence protein 1 [Sorochytrium milnesiophthora]
MAGLAHANTATAPTSSHVDPRRFAAARISEADKNCFQVELALEDPPVLVSLRRHYDEFVAMHSRLLMQFPTESGRTGQAPRTIPFLPDLPLGEDDTAARRMRQGLEFYLYDLVKLPSRIVDCDAVKSFFKCDRGAGDVMIRKPALANDKALEPLATSPESPASQLSPALPPLPTPPWEQRSNAQTVYSRDGGSAVGVAQSLQINTSPVVGAAAAAAAASASRLAPEADYSHHQLMSPTAHSSLSSSLIPPALTSPLQSPLPASPSTPNMSNNSFSDIVSSALAAPQSPKPKVTKLPARSSSRSPGQSLISEYSAPSAPLPPLPQSHSPQANRNRFSAESDRLFSSYMQSLGRSGEDGARALSAQEMPMAASRAADHQRGRSAELAVRSAPTSPALDPVRHRRRDADSQPPPPRRRSKSRTRPTTSSSSTSSQGARSEHAPHQRRGSSPPPPPPPPLPTEPVSRHDSPDLFRKATEENILLSYLASIKVKLVHVATSQMYAVRYGAHQSLTHASLLDTISRKLPDQDPARFRIVWQNSDAAHPKSAAAPSAISVTSDAALRRVLVQIARQEYTGPVDEPAEASSPRKVDVKHCTPVFE